MSSWTKIRALITVDVAFIDDDRISRALNDLSDRTVFLSNDDIKTQLEKRVNELPKITGREGDATVSVNAYDGPFVSWFVSGKEVRYNLGYSITIVGNLRDRTVEQTKKDYATFLKALKKMFTNKRFAVKSLVKIERI